MGVPHTMTREGQYHLRVEVDTGTTSQGATRKVSEDGPRSSGSRYVVFNVWVITGRFTRRTFLSFLNYFYRLVLRTVT